MRKFSVGAVHVLSCLKQKWMALSSLKCKFGTDTYGMFTFRTVTYSLSQQPYGTNISVSHILHTGKQQVAKLGLFDADRLHLATVLFHLLGTVFPVSETWLPVLTLNLLFCQLGEGG